jgi:4-amino-4-deoxy-L-arabinose transferase-like glycosyltransferase
MKLGRAWPAAILALFCIPLFVDLGHADLFGDEAIYSWGADYILQTGEWLTPVSSPYPDRPFLEKPPLKFWVVAAGIKAGLPHDEFGLRFWDALCGGLAFLYVFGIGRRRRAPRAARSRC